MVDRLPTSQRPQLHRGALMHRAVRKDFLGSSLGDACCHQSPMLNNIFYKGLEYTGSLHSDILFNACI